MIIGICGGTASGKTIFAKKILEIVGSDALIYLEHDAYYKGLDELPPELQQEKNFDHPDSLDNDLFIQHLHTLQALFDELVQGVLTTGSSSTIQEFFEEFTSDLGSSSSFQSRVFSLQASHLINSNVHERLRLTRQTATRSFINHGRLQIHIEKFQKE